MSRIRSLRSKLPLILGVLMAIVCVSALSACGKEETTNKTGSGNSAKTAGKKAKTVQGQVFKTVAECEKTYAAAKCKEASDNAKVEAAKTAPKFTSKSACDKKWGRCTDHYAGGVYTYYPLYMAFMVGYGYVWPLYGDYLYADPLLYTYDYVDIDYWDTGTFVSEVDINTDVYDEVDTYYSGDLGSEITTESSFYDEYETSSGVLSYSSEDVSECDDASCESVTEDTSAIETGSADIEGADKVDDPVVDPTDIGGDYEGGQTSNESGCALDSCVAESSDKETSSDTGGIDVENGEVKSEEPGQVNSGAYEGVKDEDGSVTVEPTHESSSSDGSSGESQPSGGESQPSGGESQPSGGGSVETSSGSSESGSSYSGGDESSGSDISGEGDSSYGAGE